MLQNESHKNGSGLLARVAQQALYMVAFGAVIGSVGGFIAALAAGTLATAATTIGIGAGIGLAATIGSTYLNGKIEKAKEEAHAHETVTEKTPVVMVMAEGTTPEVTSKFRDAIEAERARAAGQGHTLH